MNMNANYFFVITALLAFISGCSEQIEVKEYPYPYSSMEDPVVASIGEDKIFRSELDHLLAFHSSDPNSSSISGKKAILESLITDQVMYKKAIENGFDNNPEFIINQRKLLAYEYKKYLAEKVAKNTKISDLDIELYYKENIEKYTKPGMFRVAVYFRKNNSGKQYDLSLKQIKEAASYLVASEGFGKYSQSSDLMAYQYRGGNLAWMTESTKISGIPKTLFSQLEALDVGQVSEAMEIEGGSYLVRLIDKRAESIRPLTSVKEDIRQQLLKNAKETTLAAYLSKARSSFEINVDEKQLETSKAKLATEHSFGPPGFPAE